MEVVTVEAMAVEEMEAATGAATGAAMAAETVVVARAEARWR